MQCSRIQALAKFTQYNASDNDDVFLSSWWYNFLCSLALLFINIFFVILLMTCLLLSESARLDFHTLFRNLFFFFLGMLGETAKNKSKNSFTSIYLHLSVY